MLHEYFKFENLYSVKYVDQLL